MENTWVKLADYGLHPHTRGLQRLTRDAAQKIVNYNKSLIARLKRSFGGVPVYIGHPDDPAYRGQPGHSDTRAYAWIHELEAREDGLWAKPTWSKIGKELLENAHYKHLSPRWKLAENADGSWQPVELISVGLTNLPNIQGPTIANETAPQKEIPQENHEEKPLELKYPSYHSDGLPLVACALGLAPDATPEAVSAAIALIKEQTAAAAERTALINAQLDLALERGQIALSQRPDWQRKLEEDVTASNELMALPRHATAMRTPFLSDALTPFQAARLDARADFVRAVEERMSNTGEDFSAAWNSIKQTRRDVFLRLQTSNV